MQKARQKTKKVNKNKSKFMIYLIRTVHILFVLFFIFCIFFVYYSEISGKRDWFLCFAISSLLLEGLALFLVGECPLKPLHRKFGDNNGFFDLFLPKKILPYAIPFLSIVSIIGIVLIFI